MLGHKDWAHFAQRPFMAFCSWCHDFMDLAFLILICLPSGITGFIQILFVGALPSLLRGSSRWCVLENITFVQLSRQSTMPSSLWRSLRGRSPGLAGVCDKVVGRGGLILGTARPKWPWGLNYPLGIDTHMFSPLKTFFGYRTHNYIDVLNHWMRLF